MENKEEKQLNSVEFAKKVIDSFSLSNQDAMKVAQTDIMVFENGNPKDLTMNKAFMAGVAACQLKMTQLLSECLMEDKIEENVD